MGGPPRSPEDGVACVGLSGVGGGRRRCGVSLDGPLCAVQTWVSAFIYLSLYLSLCNVASFEFPFVAAQCPSGNAARKMPGFHRTARRNARRHDALTASQQAARAEMFQAAHEAEAQKRREDWRKTKEAWAKKPFPQYCAKVQKEWALKKAQKEHES